MMGYSLAAVLLASCLALTRSSSIAPTYNEGKYFAIAFPQISGAAGKCEIAVTASRGATVSVEGTFAKVDDKNFYVAGGSSKRYTFNWNQRVPTGLRKGYPIYITADTDIKVEAACISGGGEMDAFLALPVRENSKEFMHVSYRNGNVNTAAIIIIATEADTDVEIFQRVHKNDLGYVRKFYKHGMNRDETYVWHVNDDMTGSIIRADKPISVISANLCAKVKPETVQCDAIIENLPPTSWLGTMHIVPPIAGRAHTTGYIARVTAAHDNTDVWTYGEYRNRHYPLSRGAFVDIEMHSPLPSSVECTLPCLVTVFNRGSGADQRYTDSFMMYVPSVGQMVSGMIDTNTFLFKTGSEASYHMTIVAKSELTPSFMLNHRALYIKEWHCVHGAFFCDYKYANFTMSHGFHALTPTSKDTQYLAWQYAHSNANAPSNKFHGYGFVTAFNAVDEAEELTAKERATAKHEL